MVKEKIEAWRLRKTESPTKERFVLSIDGGGIRGIVPATILNLVSGTLKALGDDRPLYSHFDLIAGTSTGALLALGLSLPGVGVEKDAGPDGSWTRRLPKGLFGWIDADMGALPRLADPGKFTDLYLANAKSIFSDRTRFRSFGQVFGEKYDVKSLEAFLARSYGEHILEECMVPTMAVSYDTLSGKSVALASWNEWKKMMAKSAARGSTAAPTYFPPYSTTSPSGEQVVLVDGGVTANNPALLAYAEARKLYPDAEKIRILSLSTARPLYTFDPRGGFPGAAAWAVPLFKTYSSSQMELVDRTLSGLGDVEYLRINGEVTKGKVELDDTSDESMMKLVEAGGKLFESFRPQLESYCSALAARKDFSHVRKVDSPKPLLPGNS